MSDSIEIGAEVWLEPDMTRAQIDHCMALLADHQMPVARIFLPWHSCVEQRGPWTLDLYDAVFDSAQQHGVGIVATCAPPYPAGTHAHLEETRRHVLALVERYKGHPALDTWLLVNEPSSSPANHDVAMERYIPWLKNKYRTIADLNRAWGWVSTYQSFEQIKYHPSWASGGGWNCGAYIDCQTFWREHQAWLLEFIANTIRQDDTKHPIHVNPHGLMGNLAQAGYDLPAWRMFLTSMGASLHPAWHFGLLRSRDQYALGVSYACDLVRGASEPNPFWVTELQGGNNIYSGTQPLCPTPKDIAQWTWTSVACGAQRVIYWLLNARRDGVEAGEWSLLNLQSRPSARMTVAGEIAKTIDVNSDFFSAAQVLETPVTIILSLETMTLQTRLGDEKGNGHILEALGIYEVLQELGIPVHIKHMDDFAWDDRTNMGQFVILPHVSAISQTQAEAISAFVHGGNSVLATGLTGFYDPMTQVWALSEFPLSAAFGGTFKEVRYFSHEGVLEMNAHGAALPTRKFAADIENHTGRELCHAGPSTLATVNRHGDGLVYWVPSLIGMGAWAGDRRPLANFLASAAATQIASLPFRFRESTPGVLLRTLKRDNVYVTVVTNGEDGPRSCNLVRPKGLKTRVLWSSKDARIEDDRLSLGSRSTIVVHWGN